MAAFANAAIALGGWGVSKHHQQAVAKENSVLGAAQPEADNAISNVLAAVQGGRLTAAEAAAKLDAVVAQFQSRVSGIMKRSGRAGETGVSTAGGKCNAACVLLFRLQQRVASLKAQLGNLAPPISTQPDSTKGDAAIAPGRFGEPIDYKNAVQAFRATPAATDEILSNVPSTEIALTKTTWYVIGGVVFLIGLYMIVRALSK